MVEMFDRQKETSLAGVDLSRKGSVDEPIQPLIAYINQHQDYFTTSSCSGRILIVDNTDNDKIKKKGCKWIMTSHTCVSQESVICCECGNSLPWCRLLGYGPLHEYFSLSFSSPEQNTLIYDSLKDIEENAVFKFEPFVLHVQCRNLQDAQTMLQCGVSSGFRNSGISVGNKGRFITAIRSTHSLEAPLSNQGKLLVSQEYIGFLVVTANNKMKENLIRIERFFNSFRLAIEENRNGVKDGTKNKRKQKRKQQMLLDNDDKSETLKRDVCVDNVTKETKANTGVVDIESDAEIDIGDCLGFLDEG